MGSKVNLMLIGLQMSLALALAVGVLSIMAFPISQAEAKACHDGASWSSYQDTDQASATLRPCLQEEPTALISLTCRPEEETISVNLDGVGLTGRNNGSDVAGAIFVDGIRHPVQARYDDIGMAPLLEFNIQTNSRLLISLMTGSYGQIRFGGKILPIHLKGSSRAIGDMLKACQIDGARLKTSKKTIFAKNARSLIEVSSSIRMAAKDSGKSCDVERPQVEPIIKNTQLRTDVTTATPDRSVELIWSAPTMSQNIPTYLVASFDKAVRFKGSGFFVLLPGAAAPFGLEWNMRLTRIIIPLHGMRIAGDYPIELEILLAGDVNIEWQAVTYLRDCETFIVGNVGNFFIRGDLGKPQVASGDDASRLLKENAIVAPGGRRAVEKGRGYFSLLSTATGERISRQAGAEPRFSPTGRFISFVTDPNAGPWDASISVADTVDGRIIHKFGTNRLSWSHKDSFAITPSGIANSAALDRSYYGYQGAPDTPDSQGIRFDLENNVVVKTQLWSNYTSLNGGPARRNFYNSTSRQLLSGMTPNTAIALPEGERHRGPFSNDANHIGRFKIFEKGGPVEWELSQANGLHTIADAYLSVFKKGTNDRKALESRRLKNPGEAAEQQSTGTVSGSTMDAAKIDISELATSGAPIDQLRRALPVSIAERIANPINVNQVFKSKLLGGGKLFGHGIRTIRGNMQDAITAIKSDFPKLDCVIGVNAVPRSRHLGPSYLFLGGASKTRIFQGGRKCKEQMTLRMKRLGCGQDGSNHIREGILSGWKLDLETNGVDARRWMIDGKPVWLVRQQCMDTEEFSITEVRLHLITGAEGGTITPVQTANPNVLDASNFTLGTGIQNEHILDMMNDGTLAIVARSSSILALIDTNSPRAIRRYSIKAAGVTASTALVDNGAALIRIDTDGSFTLHDLKTKDGSPLLNGKIEGGEYVIWNDDGVFDASPEGASNIRIGFSGMPGEYHTFHQFRTTLQEQDLLTKVLSGAKLPARRTNLPPILSVDFTTKQSHIISGTAQVQSGAELAELRIYQDGALSARVPAVGETGQISFQVERLKGSRSVAVVALDQDGLVSQPAVADLGPDPQGLPQVSIVSIGIDRYKFEELNLSGAEVDARAIMTAVTTTNSETLFTKSVLNEQATKTAILNALSSAVSSSEVGDTVVISYAGHGMRDGDGNFYLSTHETDPQNPEETAIAWSQINAVLNKTKARVLLLLDACHSGAAGTTFLATNDSAVEQVLAGVPSNIIIFAASRGREYSFESSDGAGGAFSQAVADVISRDRASYDLDENGSIEVNEFYRGVRSHVDKLGRKSRVAVAQDKGLAIVPTQTPWMARNDMIGDFTLF